MDFHRNRKTQLLFEFLIKKILTNTSYYDLFDRISDEGELFIRLNKQMLIFNGSALLDNSSDVYKIVIKFLFFNKKLNKINDIYEYLELISQNKL